MQEQSIAADIQFPLDRLTFLLTADQWLAMAILALCTKNHQVTSVCRM
jgi:hypothetical protein